MDNTQHNRQPGPADHMANERTFLAWIRTSMACMGLGFVIVRFAFFLPESPMIINGTNKNVAVAMERGPSTLIGILMVGLGSILSILALSRYYSIEKQLNTNTYKPSKWLSTMVTICLFLGGVLLVWYLFP